MGTNYYARIIPKQEDKQKLIDAINNNQFDIVQRESKRLFGDKDQYENIGGIVHLGKRSGGWKFLWNANVYEYIDGRIDDNGPWDKTNFKYRHEFIYPLTKQGISDFLHRDDVIIVSEYYDDCYPEYSKDDDKLTADEFLEMAFNWGKDDGFDGKTYREWQIKNGEPTYDYYDDKTCDKWERLGYELNSGSDFYSDGLRFSTSDWFA